jgi:hypothetical protein
MADSSVEAAAVDELSFPYNLHDSLPEDWVTEF